MKAIQGMQQEMKDIRTKKKWTPTKQKWKPGQMPIMRSLKSFEVVWPPRWTSTKQGQRQFKK
jgi:hypothetical protein